MAVCKIYPSERKYACSQTCTHIICVLWGARFLVEQSDPPATFLQFCFPPISDHLMLRWQQQPSPTLKGNSRSFWFLSIILQEERGGGAEHGAASQLLLNYQQILHQWPRDSLENYCSINPRSHSYHLENETHNFLSLPKKSSGHKIQRAILKKRLKKDPSSQIQ